MKKKNLISIIVIALVMTLFTGNVINACASEFTDVKDKISSEERNYKDSFFEPAKSFYNSLVVENGLIDNLIAYLDLAYQAGYNREGSDRLNMIIKAYDDCRAHAISILPNYSSNFFFQDKMKKVAREISELVESTIPEGSTVCTEYYNKGDQQKTDDARNAFAERALTEYDIIKGASVAELKKAGTPVPSYAIGAFCCRFISQMAKEAGVQYCIPWNAGVKGLETALIKAGGVKHTVKEVENGTYSPAPGAIIVFGDSTHWRHAEIVVDYTINTKGQAVFTCIGANTSQTKNKNVIAVCEKKTRKHSSWAIRCIIEPNF